MAQLLSSKIAVVEEPPRISSVPALATAVLGMVGITKRGPIGVSTLTTSFDEFVAVFGGFTANAELTLAALGFFQNGGEQLWVTRTAHYTDITDANSHIAAKGTLSIDQGTGGTPTSGEVTATNAFPLNLAPGDTLVVDDEAATDGTLTFSATSAKLPGAAGVFAALASETFEVQFQDDDLQLITTTTEASIQDALNTINAQLVGGRALINAGQVDIESDLKGTDSRVRTTNVAAGITTKLGIPNTGDVAGSGNVADINNVSAAEYIAIGTAALTDVAATVAGGFAVLTRSATGTANSVQVSVTSTADTAFGFDNLVHAGTDDTALPTLVADGKTEGAYTGTITFEVADSSSGAAEEFNLSVVDDGVTQEVFPNLTMDTTADGYAETIVNDDDNGSSLIALTDQSATGTVLQRRPTNGSHGPLTGGDDGLTGLVDADYIGNESAANGIRALDKVQNLTLLALPGQATSAIHNAMVTYCEVTRDKQVFAIMDPPADTDAPGMVTYTETTAALLGLSEMAAIYWPRVKVVNPSTAVFGQSSTIVVPPSGHIAGVYARTDNSRPGGIYVPPAGVENGVLFGVVGFETDDVLDEKKRDIVYPKRINPLTVLPGSPRHIDGTRTLKGGGNFPTVAERRGVSFIELSFKLGLLFAKHANHDEQLRARVRRTMFAFLLQQMKNGAFRSQTPAQAFFVDVSEKLNPPSVVFANKLIARAGLATQKPTDFVILRVSQDTRALDEELASAG